MRTKQSNLAASQVRIFNQAHPIGTRVRYWSGRREGLGEIGVTRAKAEVLGGHTAIVWIDGHCGCIALSHVEPIESEAS